MGHPIPGRTASGFESTVVAEPHEGDAPGMDCLNIGAAGQVAHGCAAVVSPAIQKESW